MEKNLIGAIETGEVHASQGPIRESVAIARNRTNVGGAAELLLDDTIYEDIEQPRDLSGSSCGIDVIAILNELKPRAASWRTV